MLLEEKWSQWRPISYGVHGSFNLYKSFNCFNHGFNSVGFLLSYYLVTTAVQLSDHLTIVLKSTPQLFLVTKSLPSC